MDVPVKRRSVSTSSCRVPDRIETCQISEIWSVPAILFTPVRLFALSDGFNNILLALLFSRDEKRLRLFTGFFLPFVKAITHNGASLILPKHLAKQFALGKTLHPGVEGLVVHFVWISSFEPRWCEIPKHWLDYSLVMIELCAIKQNRNILLWRYIGRWCIVLSGRRIVPSWSNKLFLFASTFLI